MKAVTESARKEISSFLVSTRFSLSMENEQADAGRDDRTCLARPYYLARTGTQGKTQFPCSADHEKGWQPCPVDTYTLL